MESINKIVHFSNIYKCIMIALYTKHYLEDFPFEIIRFRRIQIPPILCSSNKNNYQYIFYVGRKFRNAFSM